MDVDVEVGIEDDEVVEWEDDDDDGLEVIVFNVNGKIKG